MDCRRGEDERKVEEEEVQHEETFCCSRSLNPKLGARSQKPKPPRQRYRLCPIPGCKSKPQKRLPQHLDVACPDLMHKERTRMLWTAKIFANKRRKNNNKNVTSTSSRNEDTFKYSIHQVQGIIIRQTHIKLRTSTLAQLW